MTDLELQQMKEKLVLLEKYVMEDRNFQLRRPLDVQTEKLIKENTAIPYTTTEPTFVPPYDGYSIIYFDATDYWLYIYSNYGWRSQKLGVL